MTRDAGVLRSATSLERAEAALAAMIPTDIESANLHTVSTVLVRAATARRESRGTHTREDHPEPSPAFLGRLVFRGAPTPEFVPLVSTEREPSAMTEFDAPAHVIRPLVASALAEDIGPLGDLTASLRAARSARRAST